jgi:RNA polymerase sigma-70 factor (ECF subfamily)
MTRPPTETQERFMALFAPLQPRLERFALAMARDPERARDVVAETALIAYERFATVRDPQAFLGFLFTIAARTHRAMVKREGRTERIDEAAIALLLDTGTPPDVAADIGRVYDALQSLPAKQREAVILHEIIGLPMKEIRDVQGGTLSAVKVRVMRGRRRLALLLGVSHTTAATAATTDPRPTISSTDIDTTTFSLEAGV